jgi:hypothetical protein
MTDPHDIEITNAERATRCQATLDRSNDGYDVVANLIDFLADARPWYDTQGLRARAFHTRSR